MIEQKPATAPVCWGRQYDENDRECMHQCEYRLSCKPAFQRNNPNTGGVSLPMFPQQPQPYWPGVPQQQQPTAQSLPVFPGITQPFPQPTRLGQTQSPPAFPQSLQHNQYQQQQVPPNPFAALAPNTFQPPPVQTAPALPAFSPNQPHNIVQQALHSPYFMQYYSPYPGETVFQRLAKHMMLRLGQILFQEFSNFLGLWRWPPSMQVTK